MAQRLTKDQENILSALERLGGKATTLAIARQISRNRNVNGMAQSLGALERKGLVIRLNDKAGASEWEMVKRRTQQQFML